MLQSRFNYITRYVLPVIDLTGLNLMCLVADYFSGQHMAAQSGGLAENYLIVSTLIWLLVTTVMDVYVSYGKKIHVLFKRTALSMVLYMLGFGIYLYLTSGALFLHTFATILYCLVAASLCLSRWAEHVFYKLLFSRSKVLKKVAILGSDHTALKFSAYVRNLQGVQFYGFIGSANEVWCEHEGQVSSHIINGFEEAVNAGVNDVFVTVSANQLALTTSLVQEADKRCLRLKFIPAFSEQLSYAYNWSHIDHEFPVATSNQSLPHKFTPSV